MKRPDQKIKRRFDAWLGILLCHCVKSKVDYDVYGQRLQSIASPLISSETIRKIASDVLAQMPLYQDKTIFKGGVLERYTPRGMTERIGLIRELSTWRPISADSKCQTLGGLIQAWAAWTRQDSADFQRRLYSRLIPLVKDWQDKTGCSGLGDEAVFQHRQKAAQFMDSFVKLLIAETPSANLAQAIRSAMQAVVDTPVDELEKGLHDLLGDASEFTAWEANRQLQVTLEANPQVKAALLTPEVAALVEYEEHRQGYGGDAQKAVHILTDSLAAELCQHSRKTTKDALVEALKSVGRRSPLSNLRDALRGQLRLRIVTAALNWLSKLPRIEWKVESLPDDGGIYRILIKEEK